jgi:hypothetical protein
VAELQRAWRAVQAGQFRQTVHASSTNTDRLHSSLDYLTPIEYETEYYRQINSRQQPLSGEPALH